MDSETVLEILKDVEMVLDIAMVLDITMAKDTGKERAKDTEEKKVADMDDIVVAYTGEYKVASGYGTCDGSGNGRGYFTEYARGSGSGAGSASGRGYEKKISGFGCGICGGNIKMKGEGSSYTTWDSGCGREDKTGWG